jgi:ABC-type xylose transport system permease subunit
LPPDIYGARRFGVAGRGNLKELDAIAACVIGGASLVGGRGTIFGACLGALIMASLDNGMSLLNVKDFMQDIIKGAILVRRSDSIWSEKILTVKFQGGEWMKNAKFNTSAGS